MIPVLRAEMRPPSALLVQSLGKMSEQETAGLFAEFAGNYKPGAGPALVAVLPAAILANGFGAYKLAAVVANAVAKAIPGRGLSKSNFAGVGFAWIIPTRTQSRRSSARTEGKGSWLAALRPEQSAGLQRQIRTT